jgi:phosphoribosylaminoimidazole-succinocarboxamide synthase
MVIDSLKLAAKGKVREVYELGGNLLISASDRISAYDSIMAEPVPGKGKILTGISKFWFEKTREIIANHFISDETGSLNGIDEKEKSYLRGRSMIVKKCSPLPVEFVVRGYIAGSSWKSYQNSGEICGIKLPTGLKQFQKLPEPVFTPATKAESGHDENITFGQMVDIIGDEKGKYLREKAIELYQFGHDCLESRGIIIADTKFEFGIDSDGKLILIDEALTPDSSRFWLAENYSPGKPQEQFDKQVLRDYLDSTGWDREPPPPNLPDEIVQKILDVYKKAYLMITGQHWTDNED